MNQPNAIQNIRILFLPMLLISLISNLMVLVSPIFMMQVLDRVVPTGNLYTLIFLLFIATSILLITAILEYQRDVSANKLSKWIDDHVIEPILMKDNETQAEKLQSLQTLKNFINSPLPNALFSTFWLPLFSLVLIYIHISLFFLFLAFAIPITLSFFIQNVKSKSTLSLLSTTNANEKKLLHYLKFSKSRNFFESVSQNLSSQAAAIHKQRTEMEEIIGRLKLAHSSFSNTAKQLGQLSALSLGAYLVSKQEMSAGAMIATTIIFSKILMIYDQSLNVYKQRKDVLDAYKSLSTNIIEKKETNTLQCINGDIHCLNVTFPRQRGASPILDRVNIQIKRGECVAIIGESGSGKSTLLSAMAGLITPPIGSIQIDQHNLKNLSSHSQLSSIGYVPQLVGDLHGSVAEYIAGYDAEVDNEQIIQTAKLARVHGLISALPNGYSTCLEESLGILSNGQKQQIALAAALVRDPGVILMDEPNALLDRNAENALAKVIEELKQKGKTIVMVLHRAGIIGLTDRVLVLEKGRVVDYGARSQVLGRQSEGKRILRLPLLESSLQDLSDWITSQFTRTGDAPFATNAVLLATELFQAVFLNGESKVSREVIIEFTFINEKNCELKIIEQGSTMAGKKLPSILSIVRNGEENTSAISKSERPLIAAARIANDIRISEEDQMSKFWASLHYDENSLRQNETIL